MPDRKPPYEFEDYEQATWPVAPGTRVYLSGGEPGRVVQCWPPMPVPPGHDGDDRDYHDWRGRIRLDNGAEVDAWELEIAVMTAAARARHA